MGLLEGGKEEETGRISLPGKNLSPTLLTYRPVRVKTKTIGKEHI
jgi:hypothetical protein